MKKILFLILVPLLFICSGCGSNEIEDLEEVDDYDYMGGIGFYSYNLALRFVTPEGDNLVSTLPVTGGSLVLTSRYYKIETITRQEIKYTGLLSKGVDSAGDEYIKFSHTIVSTHFFSPFKFSIVYKSLFGDEKTHTIETTWAPKDPPYGEYLVCTGFKLDGKKYPIKDDESIEETRIVVIELNRKK